MEDKEMKQYTDEQIVEVIRTLQGGKGDDDEISYWLDHELFGLDVVFDIIFHEVPERSPEEILRLARERNKPILL